MNQPDRGDIFESQFKRLDPGPLELELFLWLDRCHVDRSTFLRGTGLRVDDAKANEDGKSLGCSDFECFCILFLLR